MKKIIDKIEAISNQLDLAGPTLTTDRLDKLLYKIAIRVIEDRRIT